MRPDIEDLVAENEKLKAENERLKAEYDRLARAVQDLTVGAILSQSRPMLRRLWGILYRRRVTETRAL